MAVLTHLEDYFGGVSNTWSCDEDGAKFKFTIAQFAGGPIKNIDTYSTIGLSDVAMKSRVSKKLIRHELFIMKRPSEHKNVPALLLQIGMDAIKKEQPYLRGDVICKPGRLFDNSEMVSLFITNSMYMPSSFGECISTTGAPVVFAWLVPITRGEALFVHDNGWRKFEDKIVELETDLLDVQRASMV